MKRKKIAIIAALTLGVSISAFGITGCGEHEHTWGQWTVTTPATCTEEGEETRVCEKDASHEETRKIDALGHDWGEWEVTTPATCTEAGEETRVCGTDGNHKETRPVAATEHDWGEWTIDKKPSLTETGKATRTCQNDEDETEEKVLPKLNEEDYTVSNTASTCGEAGTSVYSYDKNGIKFSVTVEGETLKHAWGSWTVTEANKPTATAAGKATRECTRDDCDGVDELALPALTDDGYVITNNTAKCYEEGTGTYTYTKDGHTVSFTAATPKNEHDLDDGTLTPATIDADAKTTYVCQNEGCTHTEEEVHSGTKLEALTYNITVKNASGTPAKGITVKLGEYSAVTDDNGVAAVRAEKTDYTVVIENRYVYDAGKVTVTQKDTVVTLPAAGSSTAPGDGIYYATIRGVEDSNYPGKFTVRAPEITINAGDSAKLFTVTILSGNTSIFPAATGLDAITEKGESFQVVVEAEESTSFEVCTNDLVIEEGYLEYVVYQIKSEAAPAAGVKMRPAPVKTGEFGKPANFEGNEVYLCLDYATFGKSAEVTFGNGVTVTDLGLNVNNAGEPLESGAVIKLSQDYKYYLLLTFTDEESKVSFEKYFIEGSAERPITATADGAVNNVTFDISEGVYSKWYKLTVEETGYYTLSTDSTTSYLTVYKDVNGDPVRASGMGGALVNMPFEAGTPVYILATDSSNKAYSFTCAKFSEEDMGNDTTAPFEVTQSGNYKAFFEVNASGYGEGLKKYYKFTAEESVSFTISYEKSETETVGVYVFDKDDYVMSTSNRFFTSNRLASDLTSATVYVGKGDTLYFYTLGLSKTDVDTTFKVEITVLPARQYEVTVALPDGADEGVTTDGVTVKLTVDGQTFATATVEEGVAVFEGVVPQNFDIVLENVPEGYGYYDKDAIIPLDGEEKSQLTITLTKMLSVAYTVKLPDGTGAEGVKIKLVNTNTSQPHPSEELVFVTDANGVAQITVLPAIYWKAATPMSPTTGWITTYYKVTLELPESLNEYVYNGTLANFTTTPQATELTLTATVNYTLSLKDEEGNALGEGITVTVKSGSTVVKTAVTDAEGVANVGLVTGDYTLAIDGYVTGTTLTADNLTVDVKCYAVDVDKVISGGTTSSPARLTEGSNVLYNSAATGRYYEFYPKAEGQYTITITDMTTSGVYLYQVKTGSARGSNIYTANAVAAGYEDKITVAEGGRYEETAKAFEFTFNMTADDDFFIVFYGKGYFKIDITKVTE